MKGDPVLFAEGVLGLRLWSRQREFLRAIGHHDKVAVRSGHKVAKSFTLAVAAWWRFVCFPRSETIFTNSSAPQVKLINWKEVKALASRAKFPLIPRDERIADDPSRGIEYGERLLAGFTTNESERFAGHSGPYNLFILDEASGIADGIFEACKGNCMGGGKLLATGNPTRNSGWFYVAHTSPKEGWHCLQITSEEVATEVQAGRAPDDVGLATWAKIHENYPDPTTNLYRVRVLGEFAFDINVRMFPDDMLAEATHNNPAMDCELWPLPLDTDAAFRLGLDVARYGDDLCCLFAVNDKYASWPITWAKLDLVETAKATFGIARKLHARRPSMDVRVSVDVSNNGAGVIDSLRDLARVHNVDWLSVKEMRPGVNLNEKDWGSRRRIKNMRSAYYSYLQQWLKVGGKIPNDENLLEELRAVTYSDDAEGKFVVTPKDDMKKTLKRSPDRADGLAMAVYRCIGIIREDVQ